MHCNNFCSKSREHQRKKREATKYKTFRLIWVQAEVVEGRNWQDTITEILRSYRATSQAGGKSPAEQFLGRKIRAPFMPGALFPKKLGILKIKTSLFVSKTNNIKNALITAQCEFQKDSVERASVRIRVRGESSAPALFPV